MEIYIADLLNQIIKLLKKEQQEKKIELLNNVRDDRDRVSKDMCPYPLVFDGSRCVQG